MLVIRMLGGLHITLDDQAVSGFISSKAQALFCYLVLNRHQPQLRTTLAALFWGDMLDEDAATNLRQAIANLKRLFEPYFDITRQSVAFVGDQPYVLDVEDFERLQDAQIYRGDLLAGFAVTDAAEFEDWLTIERERLHHLALKVIRDQISLQQIEGQPTAAITSLRLLLTFDPLAEDAHRQLMLALALSGQRSAALAQYDACRAILQRELGVDPETETQHLYQRIRSAQRLINLPPETSPLIGRVDELRELNQCLLDSTCHLITIVGLGGIGKTRLALHVAHQHSQRTLHGAVMVNLTAINSFDFFLSALTDALGFALGREDTPRQQILNYLRAKHLLLVLDNFEQLIEQVSSFLAELIRVAPDVKLLITTRERLNLQGERVLILSGLPVPTDLPVEGSHFSAQMLFWETARRVRGDDLVTHQSSAAVTRICKLVNGMPLAIELAAAWTRLITVEELADEITTNLIALEATIRGGESRHHSLRAVFDQSWNLFSSQEKQVLMALSIFETGFSREAAHKVAKASLPMLLTLSDKMLLRREPNNRFSLHEMMRQYFGEKRLQAPDRSAIQTTFIHYYSTYLQEREAGLKSAAQIETLDEISREIENIHVAWSLAIASKDTSALLGLLTGLAIYHDLKSNWSVGERLFEQAEAHLEHEPTALGLLLSYVALFNSRHDQTEQMEQNARRCLATLSADTPEHQPGIARALVAHGYWHRLRGDYETAIQHFQQALDIRTALHDVWGCAECFLNLGSAYGRSNRDVDALHMAARGLTISQKLGDRFQLARLQILLATLLERKGDLAEAEQLYRDALVVFEQVNSVEGRSIAFNGLGNVCFFRAHYQDAQQWYLEALAIYRQLGTREWEGGTLNNLGEVARAMGNLNPALEYFQQSQQVFRQLGHHEYVDLLQKEIDATLEQIQNSNL